jgi:hypothetical protein
LLPRVTSLVSREHHVLAWEARAGLMRKGDGRKTPHNYFENNFRQSRALVVLRVGGHDRRSVAYPCQSTRIRMYARQYRPGSQVRGMWRVGGTKRC